MGLAKQTNSRNRTAWFKGIMVVLVAGAIFGLGWAGGSGRFSPTSWRAKHNQPGLPAHLDYASVDAIYQSLKANFDGKLDASKLQDGMKAGLVAAACDPHTNYLNSSQVKSFNDEMNGSFTGIGAELGQDSHGTIQVIAPLSGFPAAKAGLQAQDLIAAVNGKSTSGMTVQDAVDIIRGPAGTTVTLLIVRGNQQLTLKIERSNISVPSVTSYVKNGVGYLTISRFGDDTAGLATQAAQNFKQQNVHGVILDLRNNPGGLLDAAVAVSSLWVPQGKTILTERHSGIVTNTFPATGNNILAGIPTAVLINGGSASASEITAGALRDNGVATLVGQKSYGKGSVQQLVNLAAGTILKVTVAHWYTPDGKNIDKTGITPSKVVKAGTDVNAVPGAPTDTAANDPQLATALSVIGAQ